MNDVIYRKINTFFEAQNGYAKTSELTEQGIHTKHIKQLEEKGVILKIKRGLYRWAACDFGSDEAFLDTVKMIPNGVICLLSALSYHRLINCEPVQYQVALHRNDTKLKLPDAPPVQLIYFSDKQYHAGIDMVDIQGHKVKIYDQEKTLCDSARYQNKIGKEAVKQGFKTYLQTPQRNMEKLFSYAEQTRVKSVVFKYVDVLS